MVAENTSISPDGRKARHHVSAAGSAELAMVLLGLVVGADLIGPLCHLHVFRLPEREGIDGRRGPRPARLTVAIPHRLRLPGHLYFDGAAKACAGTDIAALSRCRRACRSVPSAVTIDDDQDQLKITRVIGWTAAT